jgi:predicted GIY-YIG superfamily endonuclease
MKKEYKVYMHIFPNNKVYIGITSQNPKRRWNNGKGYRNNEYMTNAILKYGWNNIKHEIIFDNLSKEQAEQKEIELIAQFNSNNKKYGYNILKGGNISNGLSDEVLKKMANTTKELWQNPKYREHMRVVHSGKKASTETKKKMSESNPKYWLGKH